MEGIKVVKIKKNVFESRDESEIKASFAMFTLSKFCFNSQMKTFSAKSPFRGVQFSVEI